MNKILSVLSRRLISQNSRLLCCGHYQVKLYHHINHYSPINTYIQDGFNLALIKRFKHKKKGSAKRAEQDDLESDEEDEELEGDESKSKSIITTIKVNSLRVDVIAKAGLGIARRKIEEAFFDSKIRINGKKVFKISTEVNINDEIDFIRGRSTENSNLLIVSRVVVLSAEPTNDAIKVKICKDKSLLIEDYSEPWKN